MNKTRFPLERVCGRRDGEHHSALCLFTISPDLKLKLLEYYNSKLDQRVRLRKFVVENELMDAKKVLCAVAIRKLRDPPNELCAEAAKRAQENEGRERNLYVCTTISPIATKQY